MPCPKCGIPRPRTGTSRGLNLPAIPPRITHVAAQPIADHLPVVLFRIDIPEGALVSDVEVTRGRRVGADDGFRTCGRIRRAELLEQRSIDEERMPMPCA